MPRLGTYVLADASTRKAKVKTVDGSPMIYIGVQRPPRKRRRRGKSTYYMFWLRGSNRVYRATQRRAWAFMQCGVDRDGSADRYYETFVKPPITDPEKRWLHLYGYEMIGDRR